MKIGIDASRNRSGGAKAHLIGILQEINPEKFGISEIHVWVYKALSDNLPNKPWLFKHNPPELERSLVQQLWWQYAKLIQDIDSFGIDIMLETTAAGIGSFHPSVVMSRDMLPFEKGEINRYWMSLDYIRPFVMKYIQSRSMKRADAVIFLTKHAANSIQEFTGNLTNFRIIPHGVGENFRKNISLKEWPKNGKQEINCIYISQIVRYKHQWHVVNAISQLQKKGINAKLKLVGPITEKSANIVLEKEIERLDPNRKFIERIGHVDHSEIPHLVADSDISIFASSCENMPNTLVEAMASGALIACADRGPMPEILQDGGIYFDPENPDSIVKAIEIIISKPNVRKQISLKAKELSAKYSWSKCSNDTFEFLTTIKKRN
ncbi:MAG: glycosyltransferase family 1 protein [Melioribacteraceae bacterium]|jgi:glycosyltransferase involved in cell wall biosynthesis|nr:glycosyltransferase family 1 protein [Melioribacteraceae bacterium]